MDRSEISTCPGQNDKLRGEGVNTFREMEISLIRIRSGRRVLRALEGTEKHLDIVCLPLFLKSWPVQNNAGEDLVKGEVFLRMQQYILKVVFVSQA